MGSTFESSQSQSHGGGSSSTSTPIGMRTNETSTTCASENAKGNALVIDVVRHEQQPQRPTPLDDNDNVDNVDSDSDNEDNALPFHSISYIPFGDSTTSAPMVGTPIAVIRRAVQLLDLQPHDVILDLGCGTGQFLHSMLDLWQQQQAGTHIAAATNCSVTAASITTTPPSRTLRAVGIDISDEFLTRAREEARERGHEHHVTYKLVDVNTHNAEQQVDMIVKEAVNKMYVYLVSKQLALPSLRHVLRTLHDTHRVRIVCYKYPITYLPCTFHDPVMQVFVYDPVSAEAVVSST